MKSISQDSQIIIPDAFCAIYTDALRHRLTIGKEELAMRFELCEDMANLLSESTAAQWFKTGHEKAEVLEQVHAGLLVSGSVANEAEAIWVVHSIEEELGWSR